MLAAELATWLAALHARSNVVQKCWQWGTLALADLPALDKMSVPDKALLAPGKSFPDIVGCLVDKDFLDAGEEHLFHEKTLPGQVAEEESEAIQKSPPDEVKTGRW